MSLFSGTHEVRVKTGAGIYAGYFDSEVAALSAVERLGDYTAAWATLNPLAADALTPDTVINPSELVRTYNAAADSNILRREWLLLDFDPPRPTDSNSTSEEKAAAHQQADWCRDALTAKGWPGPTCIDSGNGYHLRYPINLPNDVVAHELVRSVLHSFAGQYPMLDTTNHNAARVAKLPGTWARKGAHSDERPHRMSALLSEGSGIVTEAQLQAIAGDVTAGEYPAAKEVSNSEAKAAREWLLGYIDHHELVARTEARRITGGWKLGIYCPLTEADAHPHDEVGETSTVLLIINGKLYFKCSHNSCEKEGRNTAAFKQEMARRNPDSYAPEPGREGDVRFGTGPLPLITHATLAEAFLKSNDNFRVLYDAQHRPIAQWVGTRWDISDNDAVLQRDVQKYLKTLHNAYPEPEKGPDSRLRLYDANFISGVTRLVRPNLTPVQAGMFDTNPLLLGLPECRVVDLATGRVREMLREDYLTTRVYTTPDSSCGTPRTDRFMDEITCGDAGLSQYLWRLSALCLTGLPEQKLFFLWGTGRNGKGVFTRMLCQLLGVGKLAWVLRPEEITVGQFLSEQAKRTFADFKGRRLVTVNESVGKNLNLAMLKLISGGDALTGAKMRQDAVAFQPTHKVLLPTNEKPDLPADPAFRGRVHFIPFNACFRGREDATLQDTIKKELPGVLHKLIALCPDVIANGLQQPASVNAETEELFDELDVTKQFVERCLVFEADAQTTLSDMTVAVSRHGGNCDLILSELKRYQGIKYKRVYTAGRKQLLQAYIGVKIATE